MKRIRLFVIIFFLSISLFGQDGAPSMVNLQSSYLLEFPFADLKERYGLNNKFEFKLEYLNQSNFAVYLKSGVRLGENVKEDVLEDLRTTEGYIVGTNGFYADIFGRKRGFDVGIGFDKLWLPPGNISKQAYLRTGLSLGSAHHWVKFVDDSQSIVQVSGDYLQIYDRYVSGVVIEENIQFQWNTESRNAGFLFGIQFAQVFGKEHRVKYLLPSATNNRLDIYLGIKLSYLLPLYTFGDKKPIYY